MPSSPATAAADDRPGAALLFLHLARLGPDEEFGGLVATTDAGETLVEVRIGRQAFLYPPAAAITLAADMGRLLPRRPSEAADRTQLAQRVALAGCVALAMQVEGSQRRDRLEVLAGGRPQ